MTGDLHEAAGVAADDDLRPGLPDAFDLSAAEVLRDLRLEEVVHAGASAAELAVHELHQLEARHAPQQLSRLDADLLAVGEMTRVVIRHPTSRLAKPERALRQDLGHVARPSGEDGRVAVVKP